MEELKPVAWMWEHFGTHVTTSKKNATDLERFGVNLTPLYAIPDGYVVVPVEPTKAMINSGCRSLDINGAEGDFEELQSDAKVSYKAMIAAYAKDDATFPRGSVVDDDA